MKSSSQIIHITEMLFSKNKPSLSLQLNGVEKIYHTFSLRVDVVESLFDADLEKEDKDYLELHCLLRLCGIEFLYMKKSNMCGFMRLHDVNKWEMANIESVDTM